MTETHEGGVRNRKGITMTMLNAFLVFVGVTTILQIDDSVFKRSMMGIVFVILVSWSEFRRRRSGSGK